MPEYDNTNTGVLFVNDRQREGKKDPDRNGTINVEGVEYWLSGWLKDGKKGKFLSLSIKRKEAHEPQQRAAEKPAARPQPKPADPDLDPDDDGSAVPF